MMILSRILIVLFLIMGLSISPVFAGQSKPKNEKEYNSALSIILDGNTEERLKYQWGNSNSSSSIVYIDIITNTHVIEGGTDKRSSLDSIQQALFFAQLSGKKPKVVIYNTDEEFGRYEYRIMCVAKKTDVEFEIWFWDEKKKALMQMKQKYPACP